MMGLGRTGGSWFWNEGVTAKYAAVKELLVLVGFAFWALGGFCGWILSS